MEYNSQSMHDEHQRSSLHDSECFPARACPDHAQVGAPGTDKIRDKINDKIGTCRRDPSVRPKPTNGDALQERV